MKRQQKNSVLQNFSAVDIVAKFAVKLLSAFMLFVRIFEISSLDKHSVAQRFFAALAEKIAA